MTNVNSPLTILGEATPRTVVYKHESHKLHQAFNLGGVEPQDVIKGQPVKLLDDGGIAPYTGAAGEVYLGIALTDSIHPAYLPQKGYPVEVTVMVEAFAICNYVASGALDCGYVNVTGNVVNNHFVEVAAAGDGVETKFIAINSADAAGDIVQVLIR